METITTADNSEKSGKKNALLKICFVSLFAALIAGGTFIAIPIGPVPIVLQNLFVVLAGIVLGPVLGTAATGLFLLAGLLGAPVFAGFTGGITRFAGPTGGFLVGYLLTALTAGLIAGKPGKNRSLLRIITATVTGFLIVYVPGVWWLKTSTGMDWDRALMAGFIPYLPGDFFKGIAAVLIAKRARKTAANHLYA
jgi:biotin transport system substrate-specific component